MLTFTDQPVIKNVFQDVKSIYKKNIIYTPDSTAHVVDQRFFSYPLPEKKLDELNIPDDTKDWENITFKFQKPLNTTPILQEDNKNFYLSGLH